MINGIALALGLFIFITFFTTLESITERSLENTLFASIHFWLFVIIIWLFGSLLSGFYPAIILSSINPLKVLKKEGNDNSNKFSLRNILVTFQFLISTVLIAGTMVVLTQINFMTNQEIGINVANKIAIDIPNYIGDNNKYWQLLKNYKQDLLKFKGLNQ